MRITTGSALLLLGGIAGCGSSPPTHFYALSAASPSVPAASLPPGTVLQVDTVTIPPQLDRLQLVRRIDANQVDISSFERWAAPLDAQIRRVLSEDLTERSPVGEVLESQAAAPPSNLTHVAVDIDEFAGATGNGIVLRAHWALVADDRATYRSSTSLELPTSGGDAGAIAAGMSIALGQLADQIAMAAAGTKAKGS